MQGMPKKIFRVHYPLKHGIIVLRTENDWESNVEPVKVSIDGTVSEFHVSSPKPFLYFKPCLIRGNNFYWSIGNNYLTLMTSRKVLEIYPYFFGESNGQISKLLKVPCRNRKSVRYVRVYTPPGYNENKLKRYPVLYMHDGSNLFFPEEAFLGQDWHVDETMELLYHMNIINKVIVVAIYTSDRMNEYTYPGYYEYGQFLVEELKPWIDRRYRTLKGATNTALMGSSLGGVVTLFVAWQWPKVFGKAACMSSTFSFKDDLFQRIQNEDKRKIMIYLDSGWPGDNFEVTGAMSRLLLKRGYEFGKDLLYFAFPEARHNEKFWAARSHIPFQFFFGKWVRANIRKEMD